MEDSSNKNETTGLGRVSVSPKTIFIPAIEGMVNEDIESLITLGAYLKKKYNHTVLIGSSEKLKDISVYRERIESLGLKWMAIEGDLGETLSQTTFGKSMVQNSAPPSYKEIKKVLIPLMEKWFKGIVAGCKGADMLILSTASYVAGFSVLETYPSLSCVVVHSFPALPSKQIAPPTGGGKSTSSFEWLNNLKWSLMDLGTHKIWRSCVNKLRKEVLNLPACNISFREHFRKIRPAIPMIITYSSVLMKRPNDWLDNEYLVGPLFSDEVPSQPYSPPQDLVNFLNNGAPLYFGLGNMMKLTFSPEAQGALIKTLIEALKQANARAVIDTKGLTWNGFETEKNSHPHVYFVDSVPYSWLFPQCSDAIINGDATLTNTALLHGLPVFAIPFGADQPFNGDRVYTSGLGPKPIKIKNLNLENLTAAIAELSRDKEMKAKAVQASEIIKKETGVQSTVDIINDILENGHEVYLQKLREKYNKDYWMPDEKAPECCLCKSTFGTFVRRHHCRTCGLVFCSNCSRATTMSVEQHTQQRICNSCYVKNKHW